MAPAIDESFADIIALARARLTGVRVKEDIDIDRAILSIEGYSGEHRILIKETMSRGRRRYAYYVLQGSRVLLGFDNHADRHVLRLKYGEDFAAHIHELIPHRHGPDKASITLTETWTVDRFLQELDNLVSPRTGDG